MSEHLARSIPAVARFFGVAADVIRRDWRARGMPGKTDAGYDLAEIARWRIQYERDRAEAGEDDAEAELRRELKRRELEAAARIREADASRAERREQSEVGNVLPRDEYELAIVEAITITRDRFLALPQQLARVVPRASRGKVRAEADRVIRKALDEFAALIEEVEP